MSGVEELFELLQEIEKTCDLPYTIFDTIKSKVRQVIELLKERRKEEAKKLLEELKKDLEEISDEEFENMVWRDNLVYGYEYECTIDEPKVRPSLISCSKTGEPDCDSDYYVITDIVPELEGDTSDKEELLKVVRKKIREWAKNADDEFLISFRSEPCDGPLVAPNDCDIIEAIIEELEKLGYKCEGMPCEEDVVEAEDEVTVYTTECDVSKYEEQGWECKPIGSSDLVTCYAEEALSKLHKCISELRQFIDKIENLINQS